MNKTKQILAVCGLFIAGAIVVAADHIDAPAVKGGTADITDFYAFQGENTSNLVFVANVQGLLAPSATGAANFDENVMIEFNIDNDGDNVEDLVIQAIPRNGKMYFYGPFAPNQTGLSSAVNTNATQSVVDITSYAETAMTAENDGMKFFAGPRDDPFFMDFARYGEIIGGTAPGFSDPGDDTFKGTNVMSIVIEVPKAKLGGSGTLNTWVTANAK
ncbi:MAG: molecular chaperone DnaK [Bacteroidetes bacterium]|nr:MAG: molecular chaperone DnaK [Bacteroidota bacterium]